MKRVAIALVFLCVELTYADEENHSRFLREYGETQPLEGAMVFCEMHPHECAPGSDDKFSITPARLAELDEINRHVNGAVRYKSDCDVYARPDFWAIPRSGVGDCEDQALYKRHLLRERFGWPPSLLRITVVIGPRGALHATLTVPTPSGDLSLDDDVIRYVNEPVTKDGFVYRYVARQSGTDPRIWMRLALDVDSMLKEVVPGQTCTAGE